MEKKYNFQQVEKQMQRFWESNSVYSFDPESNSKIYSIDTPPPTVSGSLHIGHIFSYTQAEMIARFKRMQGYNVFYPFGFDDNGLPTERLVEKEEGINAKNLQRSDFYIKCIATTAKYENEFKELWQSLGFSVDWSLQYETINPIAQRISQKSFIRLLKDKKAYMKESPVLWCTECQTSIAQAELESVEKETAFNYVKFKAGKEDIIVATTRPELLYGCVCLFVNPDDERYRKYLGMSATVPLYNEIIRTWAFYTIVKSLYHTGQIPWKDIMVCGFVLAKKGEKISKSKQNSEMSPNELIKNHSADVIRYWAASSKLGTDTFFSIDELGIAKRFITKLWNAFRFALPHLQDIDLSADIKLLPVDRWIISRCRQTVTDARSLLEQYEIGAARHKIDDFFWKDLCDYYLEIIKERLYKPEIHGARERRSAQHALYYCMLNVLKLYAIYVPHITEYIYQLFFRQHEKCISLHRLQWEADEAIDNELILFGEKLKDVISDARKYKTENALSMKDEIERLVIVTEDKFLDLFRQTINDIKACCHARIIEIILNN